ncbi:MAG: penicillin acylase family protein [Acidobacteriia bacterium]|nr:penicillin acylase family protein [Terriglobia bacterium]
MSTPTSAPAPQRSERVPLFWKIVSIASTVLLLVSLVAVVWIVTIARRALPQLDGSLPVPGLSAPVKVIRDAQGVPHIAAANRHDLLFAQGFVTAQDRLWQMDALRRFAAGNLAEIFGTRFLAHDVGERYLLLGPIAARAAASLAEPDRAELQAYCDGVNAYINSHRDDLPIEFRVLKYSPAPWTPADSLLLGLHMNSLLTNFWPYELQRDKITAKLTPELAADLYPDSSWRDHPPGADSADSETGRDPDGDDDDDDSDRQRASVWDSLPGLTERDFDGVILSEARVSRAESKDPYPATNAGDKTPTPQVLAARIARWVPDLTLPGSNDWVVSGAHTTTGKPLLSNDMHLPVQMPNLWYEAHLKAADLDVAGFTLPGTPFVIVGHNQRIAWGFTNLGANVQDLFIETVNDKGEYKTPAGWKKPTVFVEVVKVKGGKDVRIAIAATRHGPIVSELAPGEKRKLALAWTIYDPKGVPISFGPLNAAQNWQQFRDALSRFPGPGQNVVYADLDGHIGYQAAGFVPLRKSGDGSLPVPGDTDDHEWTGYIPFDKLPTVFDPPSGILATANGRIVPKGYPHVISTHWMAPYRTERIYKVLESGKKFSAADMLALQMDIYSDFDHYLADKLVYAVDHTPKASPRARAAADILRSWDGRVTADSAAPTIETAARNQLFRLLLQPRLGAQFVEYNWWTSPVALENILDHQLPRWLPKTYPSYNDLLVAALEAALNEGNVPRKLEEWTWGKQETLTVEHPILGQMMIVRRWAGPGSVPISGDGYTVKQIAAGLAPSERMTVDFSDLDRSTMNVVTGQSGQIFSPHFEDQWKAWYEGATFTMPFSDAAVSAAKKHELTLEPKK